MKSLIELVSISEDVFLESKAKYFFDALSECEIQYLKKESSRSTSDGKVFKMPVKNSTLFIRSKSDDYNETLLVMLEVYEKLIDYFEGIEHDTFINLSFFSDDMISLEFDAKVLSLLAKYNFTLPISFYNAK